MESKVEALEQQNQDLKSEVGQLWEQMAQMFQILTQTNAAITALANMNAARCQNAVDNGPAFNASSGAGPNPKDDLGAQHQISGNPPPFEPLRAIEGGDKYQLEDVELCLVSDVGLPVDFKTSVFDKYKGSSCPGVHLAMYCRKMAAYTYDDKVLIQCFQDSLIEATLN
ncbi:hypothetical protein CR513_28213, partial [Mucuna pruriens]